MVPFLLLAGTLFSVVFALNYYVLAVPPKRLPALPHVGEVSSEWSVVATADAVEKGAPFASQRRIEEACEVLLVFGAPRVAGWTHKRTKGHWLFAHVTPTDAGSRVRIFIKPKWPEVGTAQRRVLDERHAELTAHTRTAVGHG